MDEIYNISKEIDFNNLTYYLIDSNFSRTILIRFRGIIKYFSLNIYEKIKIDSASIKKIEEEDQKQFKSKLDGVTTRRSRAKSKDQLYAIKNINNLYNSKEKVVKLYKHYAKIIS